MTTIERSGSFVVAEPPEVVEKFLADPERVARCLPDTVESVTPADGDGGVRAVVVVGTPAVQTRLRLGIRLVDDGQGAIAYEGRGSAPRSHVEVAGTFAVESVEDGTRVDWHGEARVGGLLDSFGRGVGRYDGIVERKIDAAVENVRGAVA